MVVTNDLCNDRPARNGTFLLQRKCHFWPYGCSAKFVWHLEQHIPDPGVDMLRQSSQAQVLLFASPLHCTFTCARDPENNMWGMLHDWKSAYSMRCESCVSGSGDAETPYLSRQGHQNASEKWWFTGSRPFPTCPKWPILKTKK